MPVVVVIAYHSSSLLVVRYSFAVVIYVLSFFPCNFESCLALSVSTNELSNVESCLFDSALILRIEWTVLSSSGGRAKSTMIEMMQSNVILFKCWAK